VQNYWGERAANPEIANGVQEQQKCFAVLSAEKKTTVSLDMRNILPKLLFLI